MFSVYCEQNCISTCKNQLDLGSSLKRLINNGVYLSKRLLYPFVLLETYFELTSYSFFVFGILGLLKNSGITVSPLPINEKVYLLTTSRVPYCGEVVCLTYLSLCLG